MNTYERSSFVAGIATDSGVSAVPSSPAGGVLFLPELRREAARAAAFDDGGIADIALSFQRDTAVDRVSCDHQMGRHQIPPLVGSAGARDRLDRTYYSRGVVDHRILDGGGVGQPDDQFRNERAQ